MSNVIKMPVIQKRWLATCWYRSKAGLVDVEHNIEELDEIHDLVERGPDWRALDRIEIRLATNPTPELTLEESVTL